MEALILAVKSSMLFGSISAIAILAGIFVWEVVSFFSHMDDINTEYKQYNPSRWKVALHVKIKICLTAFAVIGALVFSINAVMMTFNVDNGWVSLFVAIILDMGALRVAANSIVGVQNER